MVELKQIKDLLFITESIRKAANEELIPEIKSELGQYMTPAGIASFMVSLFPKLANKNIRLLDPGAGVGSLTSAFVEHFCTSNCDLSIDLTAYEIDPVMQVYLRKNLSFCEKLAYQEKCGFFGELIAKDFITEASRMMASTGLWQGDSRKFTHCIMNPPYKKIPSSSKHRSQLRTAGIETVNLYSAFVALSILLLEKYGYLVAIIPRSFCNGPYYQLFRELILKKTAIKRIHLFNSRSKTFKEDKVLQENIIIALEKNGEQGNVSVSTTSTDDTFSDISIFQYPFNNIVKDFDKEFFIHIPTSPNDMLELSKKFKQPLSDIGVNISTGPVVDFRMKKHLRKMQGEGTVPVLYPCHFKRNSLVWPFEGGKKPNAIVANPDTQKCLYPNGFYTVVRRFSSKEEKRRIVASIVEPSLLGDTKNIGLENHLNVFHENKQPLSENLARGLAVYLNSTVVDEYFRCFSGHTQVNAKDLKLITYPRRQVLLKLGEWAVSNSKLTQEMIDSKMESISK